MMNFIRISALALSGLAPSLAAQVPRLLDYQGRIAVQGVNFDGDGQFKFALVDGAGTLTYWSHDGTSIAGGPPASSIALPIAKGLYGVRLGDTSVANMSALAPAVFDHPDVRLRVWFDDGTTGFQQLTPDRRIAAVAYALIAEEVPDGAITADKLAPSAVTTAKLAPGSVTADKLSPDVTLGSAPEGVLLVSVDPADPVLLGLSYRAIHSFPGGQWEDPGANGPPSGRRRHSAVWTGSSMTVWGGEVSGLLSGQGGTYTPETNSWTLLPASSVSPARADHTAVWTGARLIVWGGVTASGVSNTGALYDPASQTWLATSDTNAPDARSGHSAVWTGAQMIVWGGGNASGALASGAVYTPPAGALADGNHGVWTALPTAGSPPSARRDHAAAWVGDRLIVWGGESSDGTALNDGASCNPASGAWTALPASGLSPRLGHTAVAAEGQLIIFGGASVRLGAVLDDGAIYNPATSSWTALSANDAPAARAFHNAVWTGSELLVTGGETGAGQAVTSAGAYHPARGRWRPLPLAASASTRQTALWSGQHLIVFGSSGLLLLDPKPPLTLYGKY